MKIMIKVVNFLGDQMHNVFTLGASVFGLFFVFQLVEVCQLRIENQTIETIIEERIESINISNEKLVGNMFKVEMYKMRFKENNDIVRPYLSMLESINAEDIQIAEFAKLLKEDIIDKRLYGFGDFLFKDLNSLIKWADEYPELKNYTLSKMYQEMLNRCSSQIGTMCCWFDMNSFTTIEEINGKYHFYPNNYEMSPCDTYIKINGKIHRGDFLWNPTRRGMHYFDVEYINISNQKVMKKQFRIGLNVV